MHRRARLLAAAALLSFAVAGPMGGPLDTIHNLRDGLIQASHRFYGLADILTGAMPRYHSLPL